MGMAIGVPTTSPLGKIWIANNNLLVGRDVGSQNPLNKAYQLGHGQSVALVSGAKEFLGSVGDFSDSHN